MYKTNLKRLKRIAEENNWKLNDDKERVKKVVGLMTDNYSRYNEYYCPCKQRSDIPQKGIDVICPCPDINMEVDSKGHCFCKLFFAVKD